MSENQESSSQSNFPLVELKNVTRQAGTQRLLNQVDLKIQLGQQIALIGPSGSGKTLLLRSIAFLDPITSGDLLWSGNRITRSSVTKYRSQVMYVPQRGALLEGSVRENLQWPLQLDIHREKQFNEATCAKLLQKLGREPTFLNKSTSDLSGGERQIVSLLRAIQLDPQMLLLDEPTAALDEQTAIQVESLINIWVEESPSTRGYLWVSHDKNQVKRIALRVLKIDQGVLQEQDNGRIP